MKIRRKKKNLKEWHKRFAWLPTKVDDTEKEYGVVWFEQYFRKQGFQKGTWTKHSKGEWMRKKLKGDFDKPSGDVSFVGGSTLTINDLNTTTTFIDTGQTVYFNPPEEKDPQQEFDFGDEDFTVEFSFDYDTSKKQQKDPRHNQW